ncbi:MAG: VOC family protein [Anaerolineae bacterium]|nr:VOC family protein [Anaerolineae bacterium]
MKMKFVHTNIVAHNWQSLAKFYQEVFGCEPVPPERNLSGRWLEEVTGVSGAKIQGIHLRLPGYGPEGPTLEIFQYNQQVEGPQPAINRPGFAHIAFAVDNVGAAEEAVLAAGGGKYGQRVTVEIPGAGQITVVYLTDPEGNIIEVQRWA